jgi:multisubunit Na+/H+ antiporter MnhC subunit
MTPTPNSLIYGPELGALAILDAALDMTIRTLAAKYPNLDDPAARDWTVPPLPASAALAAVVAGLADTARCAVLHYIATVENENRDSAR